MTATECWSTIGNRGDGSCPELVEHIHCQNCPVYSTAAHALLDREPPTEYMAAATAHFAKPRLTAQRASLSLVIFRLASEWLALPTAVVSEIARMRQIHSLPQRRGHLQGVANVHGELVVCVSLGKMLGLSESSTPQQKAPANTGARLLVLKHGDLRAVCQVDEVCAILQIQPQQLQEAPATVAKSASTYTKKVLAWGEHSVGVLNEQLLFVALKRSFA